MKSRFSKRRPIVRSLLWGTLVLIVLYILPVAYQLTVYSLDPNRSTPWWSLSRDSSAQAPDPVTTTDAIIQVYAARAVRWRGALGVHTWVTTKRSNERFYQRMEVMGFALRWGNQSVQFRRGTPDQYWYGNRPHLLREIRGGAEVDKLIDRLHLAAHQYPYTDRYTIWPGPNSNTFTAYLGRTVPELSLDLPSTAIGKDYPTDNRFLQTPPSGKGLQLSLGGLLGLLVAPEEGIELNLAGLTVGVDFSPFALKLPAVGRIGYSDMTQKTLF